MKLGRLILPFVAAFSVMSCSESDDNSSGSNSQLVNEVKTLMASGNWRVSNYFDDVNETSNYQNFVFRFNPAVNSVSVTGGNITASGTFSVVDSASNDDSISLDADFNLNFSLPAPASLIELSDDWDILSYNNNEVNLIDVSGGNGGTDLLTFTRIP
ncbi:hypothetical protein [Flavobacterium aurantiibacter]|nr:hypothetical protein [Flavobacterium aurantiibacter]